VVARSRYSVARYASVAHTFRKFCWVPLSSGYDVPAKAEKRATFHNIRSAHSVCRRQIEKSLLAQIEMSLSTVSVGRFEQKLKLHMGAEYCFGYLDQALKGRTS
jgi:hypothetical protein